MNKFHAKKIQYDGQIFDSKAECKRYKELVLAQDTGMIKNLCRQVEYPLIPDQRETSTETYTKGPRKGLLKPGKLLERAVTYVADFVYEKNGETVVEDVKGTKTKDYILKRKMMLYFHGIHIKEVR